MADIYGGVGGAARGASAGSAFGVPGAVVGGVLGGLAGAFGGGDAEERAEELAEEQKEQIRRTLVENRRRAMRDLANLRGTNVAATAASNLVGGGSSGRFARAQEAEFMRQLDWDRLKAFSDMQVVTLGGQAAVDQIRSAKISDAIGGITSAVTTFGPSIMDSFKKAPGSTSELAGGNTDFGLNMNKTLKWG